MALAPIALSSCTVSVRDPETTIPAGKMQVDVRLAECGGLAAFCDDGECGDACTGLGVCLWGVDQTERVDVPDGFVNALAIASDGCIVNTAAPRFLPVCETFDVGGQFVQGGGDGSLTSLGGELCVCVSNPTGADCLVRRKVTVVGASIENPPAVGGGGDVQVGLSFNSTDGHVSSATVDCGDVAGCAGTAADARYQVTVDGEVLPILRARTGGAAANSTTIDLGDVSLAAGETYQMCAQPELLMVSAAGGRFPLEGGRVTLCVELVCPDAGQVFAQSEVC